MSELINSNRNNHFFRWHLLSSASAIALIALGPNAKADDKADQPTVWIELGGQLERLEGPQTILAPPFFAAAPSDILAPLTGAQRGLHYSVGEEGKITFEPRHSEWVFSASVRYGQANSAKHSHDQTAHTTNQYYRGGKFFITGRPLHEFGDGQSKSNSSHLIVDFQAGKDVGLGLFGAKGVSVVSLGIRFAQFTSSSHTTLRARPMYHSGPCRTGIFPNYPSGHYNYRLCGANIQNNTAVLQSRRSVQAIGPSLSWDDSALIAGTESSMSVAFDWGINAALLFGRQRARVQHQTTGGSFYVPAATAYEQKLSGYVNAPPDRDQSRFVVIPNLGGFAGVSFRYLDAKVKFGYRGDFFFGAMDEGIDTRKSSAVGFHGPFATISVGLGG